MTREQFRSSMLSLAADNVEHALEFRNVYYRQALIPFFGILVIAAFQLDTDFPACFAQTALELSLLPMIWISKKQGDAAMQRWLKLRNDVLTDLDRVLKNNP